MPVRVTALAAALLALAAPVAAKADAFFRVPDVVLNRSVDETGSAATLVAVLAYFGITATQAGLAADLGTDAASRSDPPSILRVLAANGLQGTARSGMGEADLVAALDQGFPVIVAVRAWMDRGSPNLPTLWARPTEGPHWLIAVGYDAKAFYFEDPATTGLGAARRDVMTARWVDSDRSGKRLDRFGIVVKGATPGRWAPPPARGGR